MSEELKPCPFCGSINIEVHGMPAVFDAPDTAQCADCNACAEASNWNTRAELSRIKDGQGEAVAWQFQGRDGAWCLFANEKHKELTIKDGTWPVRALYTSPPSDPGAVPVRRELLAAALGDNPMDAWDAMKELRALLAQSEGVKL